MVLLFQVLTIVCFVLCIVGAIKACAQFLLEDRNNLLDSSYAYFWSGVVFLNCLYLVIVS